METLAESTRFAAWGRLATGEIPAHIRGLIFDCDGTLVDTMGAHYQAWTQALQTVGISFSQEQFYGFAGMPTEKIMEILSRQQGIVVDAKAMAHRKEEFFWQCIDSMRPIEPVLAVARRNLGHRKMAVASGGWTAIVRRLLSGVGALEMFPVIIGAESVARGKPSPDPFLEAARQMGLKPEECAVYEDAELGFQAAQAAGMELVDVRPWYQ